MTLDEAIERYTNNAEYERTHGNLQGCLDFRQLVEWLKELKAYQEAYEEMRKLPIVWEFGEGVSMCLTIIEDCLKEVNADADNE
jgi:hypothetical protein